MLERSSLVGLARLVRNGYLARTGWLKSVRLGKPVDANGEPIPWLTFPAIAFLESRVRSDMRVFEYGSGNSTLWWARRVAFVESCEHDLDWAQVVQPLLPNNARLHLLVLDQTGKYSTAMADTGRTFDVVVIDGRDRVNCARSCLQALKPDGVVIWDNSDLEEYVAGYEHLHNLGFRRIDFHGLGPINAYAWTTSAFYRDLNCLGI